MNEESTLSTHLQEEIVKMKDGRHMSYQLIAQKLGLSEERVKKAYIEESKVQSRVTNTRKFPISVRAEIMARFMNPDELEKFWAKYRDSKKSVGSAGSRKALMLAPITQEDFKLLKLYLVNPEKPVREIAQELNVRADAVYSRILRIAIKVVAQNLEVLDRVTIEVD